MLACLVTCMRCVGFTDVWTKLTPGPVEHCTAVEVTQLSHEPCASEYVQQTCCSAKAMQDMLSSAAARNVERASENLCMCASERMSISLVHVHGLHGP